MALSRSGSMLVCVSMGTLVVSGYTSAGLFENQEGVVVLKKLVHFQSLSVPWMNKSSLDGCLAKPVTKGEFTASIPSAA